MADPASFVNSERSIEQALIALKKGTQLIKYSRKGKPKFCPFRLSTDESTVIWYSHGEERNLKLSSVSKIVPGQRTAVFRRYLRPEKDYLSFSLIYNNGERSLDLICKDKVEAEVWLGGLKALIAQRNKRARSDYLDVSSSVPFIEALSSQQSLDTLILEITYLLAENQGLLVILTNLLLEDHHLTLVKILHDGGDFASGPTLELSSSISRGRVSVDLGLGGSDVGGSNMQLRTSAGDGFRISVSSNPSSSAGSGQDDIESLGDVYVWGEIWCDCVLPDGTSITSTSPKRTDVLTPKPLESNVVLDVQQIACGGRHIALVTRQGEVFTWGEESGGRLGHGFEKGFSRPRLVEFLAVNTVEFVACGEYHTCVVSTSGDMFTWGDGTFNAGVLGHGTNISHWLPKRVSGNLEGLQVLSIACGTWHTALATSNGKLYTFGDGTFGVLGHGDRESFLYPKEVQLLSGLKTIKIACGVCHTAAIVEVMNQCGGSTSSRKLFTWGDGDGYRLGHGSKEAYLLPNCVSSLIDYNFHQLACGNTLTVALTTSGHVFTMGSSSFGQLGNPLADGKLPVLVQDKLVGEFVEEISCGKSHIAVLTSRSEVYTWGRGANGRLGHGDIEDRKVPTLVDSLKDRLVKSISCGSNFTACISIHKWVSGADQSVCTTCRQAFGFTRKRHNCYNCGLVHCHGCSSKKALKAALAPTPGKPHRVCDPCYAKLKSGDMGGGVGLSSLNRRITAPRRSIDSRERTDNRAPRFLAPPTPEPVKFMGSMNDSLSLVRPSQVQSYLQLKDVAFPSSLSAIQNALKPTMPGMAPAPPPPNLRPASPYPRRPSPPRSVTPVFSRSLIDSLSKTNEFLNQEVTKLQNQVKNLKQKCDVQDSEISKLQKSVQDAFILAAKESSTCNATIATVKSTATQLKEVAERLPPDGIEKEIINSIQAKLESVIAGDIPITSSLNSEPDQYSSSTNTEDNSDTTDSAEHAPHHHETSRSKYRSSSAAIDGATQVIEQFEPGVYITLDQLPSGMKTFRRVKFSKRRFAEQQAEEWWEKNKDRVFKKYPPVKAAKVVHPPSSSSSVPAVTDETAPAAADDAAPES